MRSRTLSARAGRRLLGVALLLLVPATGLGQSSRETFVVLGAGTSQYSGPWKTEFVFANGGESAVAVTVSAGIEVGVCPVGPCPGTHTVSVAGNGSLTDFGESGFPVNYVTWIPSGVASMRARVFNSTDRTQGADLPVFRIKTLLGLNPDRLTFAVRPDSARTNLVLLNVGDVGQTTFEDVTVGIEAFSAGGQSLGARALTIPFAQSVFVVDVGQFLGIANPTSGQVRVTRVAGGGVFWGILPSIGADRTISIGLGAVP